MIFEKHLITLTLSAWIVAVVSPQVLCGQATASKSFRDAKYGVSFRYPASWKAEAMVDLDRGDLGGRLLPEQDDLEPIVGRSFYGTRAMGTFRYRVLPNIPAEVCLNRLKGMVDEPDKLLNATIGNRRFLHGINSAPAMGQSFDAYVYETDMNGNCYMFEIDWPTRYGNTPPDLSPAWWSLRKRALAGLQRILETVRIESKEAPNPVKSGKP